MDFFKKDLVFTLAIIAALVSMCFVPPSLQYLDYFDFGVLCTLFCLMCVVAGFRACGLLEFISNRLLHAAHSLRGISFLLVLLCFFSAMLITNDVALIAFVPLTLVILQDSAPGRSAYLIALETMAANLGSMLTPIGNPQNLYLYSYYHMSLGAFFQTVVPVCLCSLLLLSFLLLAGRNQTLTAAGRTVFLQKKRLCFYLFLFFLCLLTVLRVMDFRFSTGFILILLFFFERTILRQVDYRLLGTFAAFFVLVGNLSALEPVRSQVMQFMQGRELLAAVLVSQVISNVPAAIMLSHFTDQSADLLLGSNLGGLGTLVASLASLISYKFYIKSPDAKPLRYLGIFTLLNLGMLAALGLVSAIL